MSCTPLAAYALRCGYGLAAASSGTSDRTSRASDRADHARRTRNGLTCGLPRYTVHRPASRPIENRQSPGDEMSCAKVQNGASASRLSRL